MADVYLRRGPPARARGRAEGAAPALRRGRRVRRALPPRGVERRRAPAPQRRRRLRPRRVGRHLLHRDGVPAGRSLKQDRPGGGAARPPPRDRPGSRSCVAARFAHRRGVIHRDLKPHNVIVDDEGAREGHGLRHRPSRRVGHDGDRLDHGHGAVPVARAGAGPAVDARSDLYSIGIILFELLTGRVPFEGESAVTIALKQVTRPGAAAAQPRGAPRPSRRSWLRALEKDPGAALPVAPTSSCSRSSRRAARSPSESGARARRDSRRCRRRRRSAPRDRRLAYDEEDEERRRGKLVADGARARGLAGAATRVLPARPRRSTRSRSRRSVGSTSPAEARLDRKGFKVATRECATRRSRASCSDPTPRRASRPRTRGRPSP